MKKFVDWLGYVTTTYCQSNITAASHLRKITNSFAICSTAYLVKRKTTYAVLFLEESTGFRLFSSQRASKAEGVPWHFLIKSFKLVQPLSEYYEYTWLFLIIENNMIQKLCLCPFNFCLIIWSARENRIPLSWSSTVKYWTPCKLQSWSSMTDNEPCYCEW